MTPGTLRATIIRAVMGRWHVLEVRPLKPRWTEIRLALPTEDFADFMWAMSQSADDPPGAYVLPQQEMRDER